MRIVYNIRVGVPDVTQDKAAHIKGVRQGNETGSFDREPGHYHAEGRMGKGTARRSTSINPQARNPIDPKSPNLSPA